MFHNRRWYLVTTLLVLTTILLANQAVWAHRGHRFDFPILDLIEICPDHMTFGFALENPGEDIDVSTLSDPSVIVTATISQVVENGSTVHVTDIQFEAHRIVNENGDPIGKEGAQIDVVTEVNTITGAVEVEETTVYYAKSNWVNYTGNISDVLKLSRNQTGFAMVTFPTPLEPGTELKLQFDVATKDGAHLTEGTYGSEGANLEGGLSMRVPTSCATDNLVQNPSFEEAKNHWLFFTNGQGRFTTAAPGSAGDRAARVEITQSGSNVQLYQKNISLEPNIPYELRFDAKSNSGHNLRVFMHKHGAPYTNYGLASARVNLTRDYQTFTIPFTTAKFANPVSDARLRFWLAPFAQAGDVYMIDNIRLIKLDTVAAAGVADEFGYPTGEVFVEEDDAGLLAGGPVPEDDQTAAIQPIFLPFVTR